MTSHGTTIDGAELTAFLQQLNAHTLLLRCLGALAEQGIADRLAPGAKTAAELATGAGLHEETLYRLLRFAAAHGVFREDEAGRFHLTPLAEGLRIGVPGSVRDRLRRPWQDLIWRTYERVPDMLRTGEPAFELAHGHSFFEYLAGQPELNTAFDRTMARVSQLENPIIAASYPFERHAWVVDVGGGQGGLLAAVLDRHPAVHGVLFDQPQVLAAPEALADARFAGRWEAATGDFFRSIPPGGDLYLLKRILHDWDDARALAILAACREALRGQARLLVVDAVMKPGNEPDPNKFLDVNIMALNGGRERTAEEFRALAAEAGLSVLGITPLPAPATLSLIEMGLA
ncbi:MAG: SAM-dependent methyltransferase [Gammaproteobacteria bacterium]|nr:SAM-dependent methyltransferase [Gammaproteobacteria bacterium]